MLFTSPKRTEFTNLFYSAAHLVLELIASTFWGELANELVIGLSD